MRPLPRLRGVVVDNAKKAVLAPLPEKCINGIIFCHGFLEFPRVSFIRSSETKRNTQTACSSRRQKRSRHKCRKDKQRHKKHKNSILSPHTKLFLLSHPSHPFSYPPSPKGSQLFRDFAPSCFSRSVLRPSAVPCVKTYHDQLCQLSTAHHRAARTEPSKTFVVTLVPSRPCTMKFQKVLRRQFPGLTAARRSRTAPGSPHQRSLPRSAGMRRRVTSAVTSLLRDFTTLDFPSFCQGTSTTKRKISPIQKSPIW